MTVLHPFDNSPDEIRVCVLAADSPGSVPDEVFLLELTMSGQEADAIERLITDELKDIVFDPALPGVPAPHRLKIERDSLSWGGSGSLLNILLEIQPLITAVGASYASSSSKA